MFYILFFKTKSVPIQDESKPILYFFMNSLIRVHQVFILVSYISQEIWILAIDLYTLVASITGSDNWIVYIVGTDLQSGNWGDDLIDHTPVSFILLCLVIRLV